jgi:hypothetical protein
VDQLRRQLDRIVRENGTSGLSHAGTSTLAYVNLGLAVLGVLLGLAAFLRH